MSAAQKVQNRGFGQHRLRRIGGADNAGLDAGNRIDRGRLDRVTEHHEFDEDFPARQAYAATPPRRLTLQWVQSLSMVRTR